MGEGVSIILLLIHSTRSEGHQCCYNNNGDLVTGQPGGGNADKTSPLVNFNQHILDDLLPYVFCCRTSLTMVLCDRYEDLRPSVLANAEPYELPVPAAGKVPPSPAPLKTSPTNYLYVPTQYPEGCSWCSSTLPV